MEGLQEQVKKLNEEIAELHEDEIVALTQGDKTKTVEIEGKIEQLTFLRDHIRDEYDSRKEEAAKPQYTGQLISLSYFSFWGRDFPDEEVASIGFHGNTRNKKHGITGFLLFMSEPGVFFSTIEGPETAVNRLWSNIQQDDHHENITLLLRETITERRYPDWGLRSRRVSDVDHAVHGPLLWALAHLVSSYKTAHQYTPSHLRNDLLVGKNPLLQKGGRVEVVAAYLGVATWTRATSIAELSETLSEHRAMGVVQFVANVNNVCKKYAATTAAVCHPWIGNGMILYWPCPPQQLNAALTTTLNIVQELNEEDEPEDQPTYNVHIGVTVGQAVITTAGELNTFLMPVALGPAIDKAQLMQQEAARIGAWVLCDDSVYSMASKNSHNFKAVLEVSSGESLFAYTPSTTFLPNTR